MLKKHSTVKGSWLYTWLQVQDTRRRKFTKQTVETLIILRNDIWLFVRQQQPKQHSTTTTSSRRKNSSCILWFLWPQNICQTWKKNGHLLPIFQRPRWFNQTVSEKVCIIKVSYIFTNNHILRVLNCWNLRSATFRHLALSWRGTMVKVVVLHDCILILAYFLN